MAAAGHAFDGQAGLRRSSGSVISKRAPCRRPSICSPISALRRAEPAHGFGDGGTCARGGACSPRARGEAPSSQSKFICTRRTNTSAQNRAAAATREPGPDGLVVTAGGRSRRKGFATIFSASATAARPSFDDSRRRPATIAGRYVGERLQAATRFVSLSRYSAE